MNCLFSGAITRIGGAQKRAGGVASVKYSNPMNGLLKYDNLLNLACLNSPFFY